MLVIRSPKLKARALYRGGLKIVACLVLVIAMLIPRQSQADPAREFLLSCTYGVLAGTLVGAAALAFTSNPGDNLNMVARGASLGLYAGIFLGFYIVYGVPNGNEEEDPAAAAAAAGVTMNFRMKQPPHLPRLQIMPLISQRGLEGAAAQYEVLRF
jgi:peptidoglycan/LPS O-acetylase OafA/YrhL